VFTSVSASQRSKNSSNHGVATPLIKTGNNTLKRVLFSQSRYAVPHVVMTVWDELPSKRLVESFAALALEYRATDSAIDITRVAHWVCIPDVRTLPSEYHVHLLRIKGNAKL